MDFGMDMERFLGLTYGKAWLSIDLLKYKASRVDSIVVRECRVILKQLLHSRGEIHVRLRN